MSSCSGALITESVFYSMSSFICYFISGLILWNTYPLLFKITYLERGGLEVLEFEFAIFAEYNTFWLDVSMNNSLGMYIADPSSQIP